MADSPTSTVDSNLDCEHAFDQRPLTETNEPSKAGADSHTPKTEDKNGTPASPNVSRRTLCLGVGGAAVMLGLGSLKNIGSTPITRPPGGQDEGRLVSACIRCQKCVEVCPRRAIKPAHVETGLLNLRTPTMNFNDDYCDFCAESNAGDPLCVKVCPTEALALPENATDKSTIIGKAVINEDECLAFRLAGCRFCYDACPYEALELDENNCPHVIYDACNGCGACESVCVSLQNGSISTGATSRAIVIKTVEEIEG